MGLNRDNINRKKKKEERVSGTSILKAQKH